MPNKIKSQKTVPKPNGALSTAHNVADVIATDDLKMENNRKPMKSKSTKRRAQPSDSDRTETTATTMAASTEAAVATTTKTTVPSDEIVAVGEELLRRLQVNGTSIGANGIASSANGSTALTNDDVNHVPKTTNSSSRQQVNHSSDQREVNCVNSSSGNAAAPTQCNGDQDVSEKVAKLDDATDTPPKSTEALEAQTTTTENHQQSQDSTSTGTPSAVSQPMPNAREPIEIEYHPMPSTSFACPSHSARHSALSVKCIRTATVAVTFKEYENELQMPDIMRVIQRELSEPYSIYTYRYFIHNWPKLCFLAMDGENCIGAIVCKLDLHRQITKRGYIAMLAVDAAYRKLKVGTTLVQKSIEVRENHLVCSLKYAKTKRRLNTLKD